jgi:AcrR family transcriptional regulator
VRTKTPAQSEKILKVAARFFALHRFHEARMEDIAAAAEVGKGTLYRYFKDKDQLYMALLARASEQMSARLREVVERPTDPRTRLVDIVEAIINYFDEQPYLFDLIHHAEVMQKSNREFPWKSTRELSVRVVKQVFEEGKETGAFVVADPDLGVVLLLGSLRGIIRFHDRPRSPDLAARIVDTFLYGAACGKERQGCRAPFAREPREKGLVV